MTAVEKEDVEGEVKPAEPPQPPKSVEQNMQELLDARKRNLDQWCFAEHLEPAVLLQVYKVLL